MADLGHIYLDHAASTPVHPEVRDAVVQALSESYGNPSSIHSPGRRARRVIEEAREAVAEAIAAEPRDIVFTSGATEADNLAVRGILDANRGALLTSPLEHSAVLSTARALKQAGEAVVFAVPTPAGEIDAAGLERALAEHSPKLVALMLVNNETGVRTRIEQLAPLVHKAGALLFCDAVQAFGFEPLDVAALGVDALALSAHKAYGPKGVGALWVRNGVEFNRIVHGGEQERGARPGTYDTPAIAGMGMAARLAGKGAERHGSEVAELRDLFEQKVRSIDGITINAERVPRGPKHSSVSVGGVDGEALLMSLDSAGVFVSAGSACSAGSIEPSRVLTEMGLSPEAAKATVRFSFGAAVTREQVLRAVDLFENSIRRCRLVLA